MRKALNYAIDTEAVRRTFLFGLDRPTTCHFYSESSACDRSLLPRPYDAARAAQLLDEAGWRDHDGDGVRDKDGVPLRFTFLMNADSTFLAKLLPYLQQELTKIGVAMEIKKVDWALFTQLVYPARTAPRLWAVLCEAGEPVGRLAAAARAAARARIDIATFGGPPRYSWAPSRRCRVVHVINHRGAEPRAGALGGALYTEGGDYVQQLGIAGSDVPPGSAKERELTARLDAILGAGCDPRAWREHLRHGARVPHHGFTWLVDYGDRACFRTASGRSSGTASTPPTRRCCSTPACWRTTSTVDTRVIAALESALGGCEDDSDDAHHPPHHRPRGGHPGRRVRRRP